MKHFPFGTKHEGGAPQLYYTRQIKKLNLDPQLKVLGTISGRIQRTEIVNSFSGVILFT